MIEQKLLIGKMVRSLSTKDMAVLYGNPASYRTDSGGQIFVEQVKRVRRVCVLRAESCCVLGGGEPVV